MSHGLEELNLFMYAIIARARARVYVCVCELKETKRTLVSVFGHAQLGMAVACL